MMAVLSVSVPLTKSSSPSIAEDCLSKIHSDWSPLKVKETAMPGRPVASTALGHDGHAGNQGRSPEQRGADLRRCDRLAQQVADRGERFLIG